MSTSILQSLAVLRRLPAEGFTFYDIGCGKGQVLFLATKFGFERIVGIDIVAELIEVAKKNADHFRRRHPEEARIEFRAHDARSFPYPDADSVFYFFNPLPRELFPGLIEHIERCVATQRFFVVIVHPVTDAYLGVLAERGYEVVEAVEHHFSRSLILTRP